MTASGGERAALVEAVMPFLDEWQVLLKDIRQLTPERVNGMLERAERLRLQADFAGQGGIVHHLEVCIQCLQAPGLDRRGVREALRNLSEVTWQLKQEAGAPARRAPGGIDPGGPGLGGPDVAGPQSMARPPLLSDAASPAGSLVPREIAPGAVPPAGALEEPPRLDRSLFPSMPRQPVVPPRADPARPEPAASPPQRPFQPAGPRVIPGAGAQHAPAQQPSPRILGGPAPAEHLKLKDKPNLLVATMFGLRAFGRANAPASALPALKGNPAPVLGQKGVLGLGKKHAPAHEQNEPRWVGPREGGLPELATRGPEAAPPPDGLARDIDDRLRKWRSNDDSSRAERRSSRPPSSADRMRGPERARSGSRSSPRPSDDDQQRSRGPLRRSEATFAVPWWIGAAAVALVGLIVAALLVFGRSQPSAPPASGPPLAVPPIELPPSRLTEDKERIQALNTLVHDYGGGESPELSNLVNEEAAFVYQVMEETCGQTGDKCRSDLPTVAGTAGSRVTSKHQIHHLFEDRQLESLRRSGGEPPDWLDGLSTPVIGAEDDPKVRQAIDRFTKQPLGREEFKNLLFRCGAYRDLIEKTLVEHSLPKALLALVMTESGCLPHAKSNVGAVGLWQFMPATARAYHLLVKEGVVDERLSPPKSTKAAVKFLSDLYRKMGSWEFAMASYNMGAFGLSVRIRRAGGNITFWDLAAAGFLPDETARYVPRIQAYALILENLARFDFSMAQARSTELTAEIEAPPGTRLSLVARAASTSLDHLKLLNPDIVGTSVPDLPGVRFMVQIPTDDVSRAHSMLERLLATGDRSDRCVSSAFDWGSDRFSEEMCETSKPTKKGSRAARP